METPNSKKFSPAYFCDAIFLTRPTRQPPRHQERREEEYEVQQHGRSLSSVRPQLPVHYSNRGAAAGSAAKAWTCRNALMGQDRFWSA
jgi:hypothetical protein